MGSSAEKSLRPPTKRENREKEITGKVMKVVVSGKREYRDKKTPEDKINRSNQRKGRSKKKDRKKKRGKERRKRRGKESRKKNQVVGSENITPSGRQKASKAKKKKNMRTIIKKKMIKEKKKKNLNQSGGPTFQLFLFKTVKGERLEVVDGRVILDHREFGVDEGEEKDIARRTGHLHRFHRDHVAKEREGSGTFQFTLSVAVLLSRVEEIDIIVYYKMKNEKYYNQPTRDRKKKKKKKKKLEMKPEEEKVRNEKEMRKKKMKNK